ncbi:hypothetical protein TNCV_3391721 [Trichonephila clavipes]|nr:hypothetical protein TNCV_3391721 [Trichonephila clavipes]
MSQRSHLTQSEAWKVDSWLKGVPNTKAEFSCSSPWSLPKWDFSRIWRLFFLRLEMQAKDQGKVVDLQQNVQGTTIFNPNVLETPK